MTLLDFEKGFEALGKKLSFIEAHEQLIRSIYR